MSNTLFLRLEGALQSWGERGRWSIRDSVPEPTKSGVIGLLACAMGYSEDTPIRELSEQLAMGVRIDRPGTRLTDYHTIGGGYEEPMLLTAQGKPKKSSGGPHTEISERDYLCGASFLVALQGPEEVVASGAAALLDPTWVIFLGRKSCPPSRPVYDGTGDYADLTSALVTHRWPEGRRRLRAVLETSATDVDAIRRRDHPVSRRFRRFHPRYTRTAWLHGPENSEEDPS